MQVGYVLIEVLNIYCGLICDGVDLFKEWLCFEVGVIKVIFDV